MNNKEIVFAFDIGIGSTGVAVSDGMYVFEQATGI